jgi:gephyrin
MTSVVAHGLKQLQGGSGEDVHPPRETVKQGNATAHTVSAGLDTVQDEALQGYPAEHSGCGHRHRHEAPESQDDRDHHHHHHHHRHHHKQEALSKDPSAAVSGRLRQSPFPLISLKEALAIVDAESKPLPVETVKTGHKLKNYVLAEDVLSATDLPVTRTTAVDGYAVVADAFNLAARGVKSDEGLVACVARGRNERQDSNDEKLLVYRINTGGPLPSSTDSVIMVEDTELVSGQYSFSDSVKSRRLAS